MDEITVDIERLRRDLEDNWGCAMTNGFPMAVINLGKISSMSAYELCEYAQEQGIDLGDYQV